MKHLRNGTCLACQRSVILVLESDGQTTTIFHQGDPCPAFDRAPESPYGKEQVRWPAPPSSN